MLKLTVLAVLFVSACALDSDTSETSQLTEVCEPGCECPPDHEVVCTYKKGNDIFTLTQAELDALNEPGDNKVTFCHHTGRPGPAPFNLLTTSPEGCENGHLNHTPGGGPDVFPTTLCAD